MQQANEKEEIALAVENLAEEQQEVSPEASAAAELLHASIHLAARRQAEIDARVMQEAIAETKA